MRTKEQIAQEMDIVQAGEPALARLNSVSQVSFVRLLKNMWVLLVLALEQRWDALVADLGQTQREAQIGSLAWYARTIRAFQYGDAVSVYDGVRVGYAAVDATKQIIQQAAVTEQADGRLLVKVAKADGLSLGPLAEAEMVSLREYIRLVKYAGVVVDVISLAPDSLRLDAVIVYDRQVLNGQGQEVSSPGARLPVIEGIFIYLRTIRFDSTINLTNLTDYVQKLPGVIDFSIRKAEIKPSGASAWQVFERETTCRAGHATLDYSQIRYV